MKRSREQSDIAINDQLKNKRARIVNKFLDVIDNPDKEICKTKNIKINTINFNVDVGPYNVQIFNMFGNTKFLCSCNPNGVYMNFTNNYCKHITYAMSELLKMYVKENENYFKEKKNDVELKENIEFLKSNISNITI
jgi:hypothetical protein